jgi:purine-binding chemotaxis protein CheW
VNTSVADESDALKHPLNEGDLWERVRMSIARIGNESQRQQEPKVVARKLAARAEAYRSPLQSSHPSGSIDFLTFSSARQRYGVMIGELLEIEPLEHFCPVPQAPAFIRGVIQWRGTILTLLDLSQLFRIPQQGIVDLRASLIIGAAGKQVAIAASEVEEILNLPVDEIKSPPMLSGDIPSTWLFGVYDNNRMLIRMDEILNDERMTRWRDQRPNSHD